MAGKSEIGTGAEHMLGKISFECFIHKAECAETGIEILELGGHVGSNGDLDARTSGPSAFYARHGRPIAGNVTADDAKVRSQKPGAKVLAPFARLTGIALAICSIW
jgi:hypothetical protein